MAHSVSVVIPVYNGERFLAKALDSVLQQTYPALEIIVVDDGSTDHTARILGEYAGRVRVIRIPNSGGCSVPRNVGMSASTGDYIALMDADDVWYARKLERQMAAVREFPGARLFCTDFYTRHEDGRLLRQFDPRRFSREIRNGSIIFDRPFDAFALLVARNFVGCPSTVLMARSLVSETGNFNAAYDSCEDLDYWLRCSTRTPFVILSRPLVYKRTHGANMSANQFKVLDRRRKLLLALWTSQRQLLKEKGAAASCRRILAQINLALAHMQSRQAWRAKLGYFLLAARSDMSLRNLRTVFLESIYQGGSAHSRKPAAVPHSTHVSSQPTVLSVSLSKSK